MDSEAVKKQTNIKRPKGTLIIKYKGHTIECVKIAVLAKMCGVKAATLRRYERKGSFPKPMFRTGSKTLFGKQVEGERLYSRLLAEAVAAAFQKVQQGKPVPTEVKQEIAQAFKREREKYATGSNSDTTKAPTSK